MDVGVVDRGRCIMVDTSCHFFYSDCNKTTTLIEKTLRQSTPKGVYNGLTRAFSRGINTDCVNTLKHSTLVHADWPFLSRGSVGVGWGWLFVGTVCLPLAGTLCVVSDFAIFISTVRFGQFPLLFIPFPHTETYTRCH